MQQKPIVDGLERELAGRVQVIRINALDPQAADLRAELRLRSTPTYVLLDARGQERWRASVISRERVERSLEP